MKNIKDFNIILASKSPRRQQLLRDMGLKFSVRLHPVNESFPNGLSGEEVALFLCEKKASAFANDELNERDLLITADTIVCLGNEILNKPAGREEAVSMLRKLSGKAHQVITGVCLKTLQRQHAFFVSSTVYFNKLRQTEIEYYIDHFQPYDKAGSYGIQEWIGFIGVDKIEGSYFNVVGFPTARLYEELMAFTGEGQRPLRTSV